LLFIISYSTSEVIHFSADLFQLFESTDDCIDIFQLKFDDIVEDPNRWVVVVDLLGCVLELWFIGLGGNEQVWVYGILWLLYWRLLRRILALFFGLLLWFWTTFTVYFINDWSLLFDFSAIKPVRKNIFVLWKQCLI
jgi:hypothetical protein